MFDHNFSYNIGHNSLVRLPNNAVKLAHRTIHRRVLETSHVALLATCYYGYTVTNYGDYEFLAKAYW